MIRRIGTSLPGTRLRSCHARERHRTSFCSWWETTTLTTTGPSFTTITTQQRQLWQTTSSVASIVSMDKVEHPASPLVSAFSGIILLGGAMLLQSTLSLSSSSSLPTTSNEGEEETNENETKQTQPSALTSTSAVTPPTTDNNNNNDDTAASPFPYEQLQAPSGEWKDGLLYDKPEDDLPTHCAFCNLYRQGPCRPWWRPAELCFKRQYEVDPPLDCASLSNRFITECLQHHFELYTLIDFQTWQDEVFDDIDLYERQSAYQDLWALTKKSTTTTTTTTTTGTLTTTAAAAYVSSDVEPIPLRIEKLLKNDKLYELMHDNYVWNQSIRIDWSRWAKYVHYSGWKREDLQLMIQAEQAARQQRAPVRPVWWSTAPSSTTEGLDQIVEFFVNDNKPLVTTSVPTSVPWLPRTDYDQYGKDDNVDDIEPNDRNTAHFSLTDPASTTKKASDDNDNEDRSADRQDAEKKKKMLVGDSYWNQLTANPMLVPTPVFLPKIHPRQQNLELMYAFCRDSDNGIILGYYYNFPEKRAKEENSNNKSEKVPATSGASPPETKGNDGDGKATTNQEPPIGVDTDASASTFDTVDMLVHIMPGRTSSFQFLAAYASDDGEYLIMETAPVSIMDSIFVASTLTPGEEDVKVHDEPQGLGDNVRERFERYQILHNLCKYQSTAAEANTPSSPPTPTET